MSEFSVRGTNVVVVGAARSGMAAAVLLAKRGAHVTLSEMRSEVSDDVRALRDAGIALELGAHRTETFASADLVVLSPGVSPGIEALDVPRQARVPIISELELAARWLQGPIVAVTGTKGKSTTVVLLGRMLEAGGSVVLVGGNVGTALSTQVEDSTPDSVHVVEVSSFQLELATTFRPSIGVFLNLYSDHLDRHGGHEAYVAAKSRLFARQNPSDTLVVNADDPEVMRVTQAASARRLSYALTESLDDGVVVAGDQIVRRTASGDEPLVPLAAVRLLGRHLLSDVLAASAVANELGVPARDMTRAVQEFAGLEHALQSVAEVGRVRFVNDSKATNIEAARRALESCGHHIVPIMGGRFKGGDLRSLRQALEERADTLVVLGEARAQIRDAVDGAVRVVEVGSLNEAVRVAYGLAVPGGTVLLAPACASFDMFRDYAERGRVFIEAVHQLREEVNEAREQ